MFSLTLSFYLSYVFHTSYVFFSGSVKVHGRTQWLEKENGDGRSV